MKDSQKIREEALRFLKNNYTAVMATAFEGEPYAATVFYTVDDDFNFYFVTRRNTNKYMNSAYNGRIAIAIGTGPKVITVQARGNAETLTGTDLSDAIVKFNELRAREFIKNAPVYDLERFQNQELMALKLIPMSLNFLNLNDEDYPESMGNESHKIFPYDF